MGIGSLNEVEASFYNLDEEAIRNIAESYGVNYYLGLADKNLPFTVVYSDGHYAVYGID